MRRSFNVDTVAFPAWALHMPCFRGTLFDCLSDCDGEVLRDTFVEKDPETNNWMVSPFVQKSQGNGGAGPWWTIENHIFMVSGNTNEGLFMEVLDDLRTMRIPFDYHEDVYRIVSQPHQLLGRLSGETARTKGLLSVDEVLLPDSRLVGQMNACAMLGLLEQGKQDDLAAHLKEVIASEALIEPLDHRALTPREQSLKAFQRLLGWKSDPEYIESFLSENPGFVKQLQPDEKALTLAVLLAHGRPSTFKTLCDRGMGVNADMIGRGNQILVEKANPFTEKPLPEMTGVFNAFCARERAFGALSMIKSEATSIRTQP